MNSAEKRVYFLRLIVLKLFLFLISSCSLIRYYGFTIDHNTTERDYKLHYNYGSYIHKNNSTDSQFISYLYYDEFVRFSLTHLSCNDYSSELRVSGNSYDRPVDLQILELEIDVYDGKKRVEIKKYSDENPKWDWDSRILTFKYNYDIGSSTKRLRQHIKIRFVINGEEHYIEDSFIINKKYQYNGKDHLDGIWSAAMSV